MRLFDDKLRLFGKVNVIDLALVILGLFSIGFVIIFSQFYKYPKPVVSYIEVYGESKKVGIKGRNFSRTSKVYFGDKMSPEINFLNDQHIEVLVPKGLPIGKYDVKVANKKRAGLLANGLTIKTPESNEKWLKVKIKFSGLPVELADYVKEEAVAINASGKIVGKITKIINRSPSKIMAFVGSYNLFDDPIKKDIVALWEILTVNKDSNYYYQDKIVEIKSTLKFEMGLFNVEGLVTDFEK